MFHAPALVVGVDPVKAALCSGEAEVADQSVGDAVGLQPSDRWVLRLHFPSVEKLESSQAQVALLAVIAHKTLLEKRSGRIGVGVGRVVRSAQAQLTLRGDGRDGVAGRIEHRRLRQLQLPVPAVNAAALRRCAAMIQHSHRCSHTAALRTTAMNPRGCGRTR